MRKSVFNEHGLLTNKEGNEFLKKCRDDGYIIKVGVTRYLEDGLKMPDLIRVGCNTGGCLWWSIYLHPTKKIVYFFNFYATLREAHN